MDPRPMLPTLADKPFDDDGWLFELKWDGVRAICSIDRDGRVTLTSRNGLSLVAKFPELDGLAREFTCAPIVVDGEIVSLDADGHSSFQRLQGRFKTERNRYGHARDGEAKREDAGAIGFAVFDMLKDGKRDMRSLPLELRKKRLKECLKPKSKRVLFSKHVIGEGKKLFVLAQRQGLEGIVGKRRDSPYQERRSHDWVKIKTHHEQEFVIGGWTDPQGSRHAFGALLAGVYDKGKLRFCGGVGTGFTQKTLSEVMAKLRPLATSRCPFAEFPQELLKKSHWVKPQLLAQVKFAEWTHDGLLRAPVFLGLRIDKDARQVVREEPA
jgi:bifunctional non-homologous end joining protein LigD